MPSLRNRLYLGYILLLLLLVNAVNIADRLVLGIMQEPIKHEFRLSDFQLGLLGGPVFAVLYSLLSLPIARFAEWGNRISIIALATALWSGATALCGFAQSYAQLLLCRLGVSVGEAGASPPSLSFLSDKFPPQHRGLAIAIYATGGSAGTLIASFAGSWLAQHYGWRTSFLLFGACGLVLAIVVRLTIGETRTSFIHMGGESLRQALGRLRRKRSLYHICAAGTFGTFCGTFIVQYMASFLIRVHHFSLTAASSVVGLSIGVVGMAGVIGCGWLGDRFQTYHPAARIIVGAIAFLATAVFYTMAFWLPAAPAVAFLLLAGIGQSAYPAICYTAATAIAPAGTRATTIAIFTLCVNILGYAFGPPLLGALSDFWASRMLAAHGLSPVDCLSAPVSPFCAAAGAEGLRIALTVAGLLVLGGAFHFWRAASLFSHDLADRAADPL